MDTKIKNVNLRGIDLTLFDYIESNTIEMLDSDFNNLNEYGVIDKINFKNNDIVIDIGANVGITSIYLAKKHPNIKIYAFEPVYFTYKNLLRNLHINNIKNVIPFNLAVSKKDIYFTRIYFCKNNSGASSAYHNTNSNKYYHCRCITLDETIKQNNIKNIKLLKIDCEGAEFDILYNTDNLNKIEYITGETHSYDDKKNNKESLLKYLENYIDKEKISFCGY